MKKILIGCFITTILIFSTGCDNKNSNQKVEDVENDLRNSISNQIEATWNAVETEKNLYESENNEEFSTDYKYSEVYNDYSEKLKNDCSSSSKCLEVFKEGVKKMAEYRYFCFTHANVEEYSSYEEWSKKLGEIYIQELK